MTLIHRINRSLQLARFSAIARPCWRTCVNYVCPTKSREPQYKFSAQFPEHHVRIGIYRNGDGRLVFLANCDGELSERFETGDEHITLDDSNSMSYTIFEPAQSSLTVSCDIGRINSANLGLRLAEC